MSNYRLIKPVLIAVIWITILVRGTLVMAQTLTTPTTEFTNVATITKACEFLAGPLSGELVESYSGGDTTSLVANGDGTGVVKGLAARALIDCTTNAGNYAIITSPEYIVPADPSLPNISSIITTGITTLYRGGTIDPFDPTEPLAPMVSVVGDGKTQSQSSPVLLTDSLGNRNFADPTWFLMGMEILLNRQGAPSGDFSFKSQLTLLPR
ncbi:hypothetical protein NWP21_18370 [Anabaenopsis sp. FSS-46]|uniref:hypothetical protein n=1 Tax=Anabaenopsis sp. FSS-46 TaxID=2971766 RepID=UPI0024738899|nr:hypothetical protein [Anabaenopsis sp. FSS-46]MDH6100766.1 hypothetical protein [Anabaenopsis sp. FSS-46]